MSSDKTRKRIVLDTSTLISAVLKPQSTTALAVHWAWEVASMVASQETLNELQRVLSRDKFDRYRSLSERQAFFEMYCNACQQIEVHEVVTACRDPLDDKFLALAMASNAEIIISSDNDLLCMGRFHVSQIMTPKAFIELCE